MNFSFCPKKKLFIKKVYKANCVALWYEACLKRGLQDIKFLVPPVVKERALLGFSNTSQGTLVCFYRDGVSCFPAYWEFDQAIKMWNVLYTEHEWKEAFEPHFEKNVDAFKDVLVKIKKLAVKIDCNGFADVFQKALDILSGVEVTDSVDSITLPDIPAENLRLFRAASTADVFGAMGSWNDSPPYMAHEKGMDKEYGSLSEKLLKQIRLATLYAINEW